MSISIENKTRSYSKEEEKTFQKYLKKAMDLLISKDYVDDRIRTSGAEVSVDVRFVGTEGIRRLNAEHREKDAVTDVLSFPVLDMTDGKLSSDLMPYDFSYSEKGVLDVR